MNRFESSWWWQYLLPVRHLVKILLGPKRSHRLMLSKSLDTQLRPKVSDNQVVLNALGFLDEPIGHESKELSSVLNVMNVEDAFQLLTTLHESRRQEGSLVWTNLSEELKRQLEIPMKYIGADFRISQISKNSLLLDLGILRRDCPDKSIQAVTKRKMLLLGAVAGRGSDKNFFLQASKNVFGSSTSLIRASLNQGNLHNLYEKHEIKELIREKKISRVDEIFLSPSFGFEKVSYFKSPSKKKELEIVLDHLEGRGPFSESLNALKVRGNLDWWTNGRSLGPTDLNELEKLPEAIEKNLVLSSGMSLLRLNEGEAYLYDGFLPKLSDESSAYFERHWWDGKPPSRIESLNLENIECADFLGVPFPRRVAVEDSPTENLTPRQEGLLHTLEVASMVTKPVLVPGDIGLRLLLSGGLYRWFDNARQIVIISSFSSEEVDRALGIEGKKISHVCLPGHKNRPRSSGGSSAEVFDENIVQEILDHAKPGTLMLFAGGVQIKKLVIRAAQRGSVSLDIGSGLDSMVQISRSS